MKIVVASKSIHKVGAVAKASGQCGIVADVVGVAAPSGINEQPAGLESTSIGAHNRLRYAMQSYTDADMWIAIESGVVGAMGSFYDIAVIVGMDKTFISFGAIAGGHMVPREFVEEARARGFDKCTAGSIMAKATGCDSTDGTSWITSGAVSRMDTLVQGVAIALADWQRRL